MESPEEQKPELPPNACIVCSNPNYETGYEAKICTDCRNKMTRLQFPPWIKLFGIAVIAITIYGFFIAPGYLSDAAHLQGGRKAMQEKRFATAIREYEAIVKNYPKKTDLKGYLFHAYYMSADYANAINLIPELEGRNTEDVTLASLINSDLEQMNLLFGDTVVSEDFYLGDSDSAKLAILRNYLANVDSKSSAAMYMFANQLFDMQLYAECDSVARQLYNMNPSFPGALHLLAAIAREQGKYDEGIRFYDMALDENREDVGAICGKARIELKRKNDSKAKAYADEARAINTESPLVKEVEILLAYLGGKTNEAKAELEKMRKASTNPGDTALFNRIDKYVSGKVRYR